MAIKQTQHCDRCGVEIAEEKTRPGFPQISWCFFRKALGLFKDQHGAPVLQEQWVGKVNRLEFCQEHGQAFNQLLKGFVAGDARVVAVGNELNAEDLQDWSRKQNAVKDAFDAADAEYKKAKAAAQVKR